MRFNKIMIAVKLDNLTKKDWKYFSMVIEYNFHKYGSEGCPDDPQNTITSLQYEFWQ